MMRVLALAMSCLVCGCAAARSGVAPTPSARGRAALGALEVESFADARDDLLALSMECASGAWGREALLLLAAGELDTGNPQGSPRLAAHAAAAYLLLPDASPENLPLARALYRLGVDLAPPTEEGAPLPSFAPRFDTCDPNRVAMSETALPTTPTRWGSRMSVLRAHLAARSESLRDARTELEGRSAQIRRLQSESAALEAEIGKLQAEIQRITELLKSGMPGHRLPDRR